eukprot:7467679-Pyramimonas_sp.AAC.1
MQRMGWQEGTALGSGGRGGEAYEADRQRQLWAARSCDAGRSGRARIGASKMSARECARQP